MTFAIKSSKIILGLGLCAGWFSNLFGATFTVSKDGRGAYTSIQQAINAAGKGYIIEILDAAVYEEQVTIDSTKAGLTLRSKTPTTSKKPTIKWQDKVNVGPRNCEESKIEGKINFDQNAALRIMRTRNITVEGIAIDGGGVFPFSYPGVWNCKDALFHGNGGISLFIAGDVTIRHCDITNSYFGINVKDRNEGGIFANANPADIEPWNVVPLSGFGRTGNHLFEHNRIHHNSWGMFFESTWDLASTVRYNLIYENHHTPAMSKTVRAMADGSHQPGGAIQFKDMVLSPLGIYNNTFWHNFLIFGGHWRAGVQHLIFNNIYASPFQYWADNTEFQNPFHKMDHAFVNRMKHSIYATQAEAPKTMTQVYQAGQQDPAANKYVEVKDTLTRVSQVRIMNDMDQVEKEGYSWNTIIPLSTGDVLKPQTADWVIQPGARILGQAGKPFPADANVRWYEIQFKSTDPASPDFLSPDWDDPVVAKYIKDGGWPEAGIRDADGSMADIGAVSSGGTPADVITIKPISPVLITGTSAIMTFSVTELKGRIDNPKIKYVGWQNNLAPDATSLFASFGGNSKPLPESVRKTTEVAGVKIEKSGTTLTLTVPARGATDYYAFAEVIVEGTGSNGQTITSNVGFLPYRKLDYKFLVEIYDMAGTKKLTQVQAGEPVKLKITPQKMDGTPFTNLIKPVEIKLNSAADLLVPSEPPTTLTGFPEGITGARAQTVTFTKVPPGGIEFVTVTGLWQDADRSVPFFGASDGIRILPGPAEKVVFQDPPSKILNAGVKPPAVDPGQAYVITLQAFDKYDNKVDQAVDVSIQSNAPAIGDIEGAKSGKTDSTGKVTFKAVVTNGGLDEVFEMQASLAGKTPDKADLKVGKARDKLWILYSDLNGFDEKVELRGSAGERKAVTIRASIDGQTALTERQNPFKISLSPGLAAYESESATDPKYDFILKNGEIKVWITGTAVVENGNISAAADGDNTLLAGNREKIYFTRVPSTIANASYHADNGFGRVDRVEVYYKESLKAPRDSLAFHWPDKTTRLVARSGITLDPADPKHLTVRLAEPFAEGMTAPTGSTLLGIDYVFDKDAPGIPVEAVEFEIKDEVGPLLASAQVQEKLEAGDDILFVAFTEKINLASITGSAFTLIKKDGGAVDLTVLSVSDEGGALKVRLTVKDEGAQAPTAGDSLKIASAGPLTDASGNKAHKDNRPVALGVKAVPAGVKSAYYKDAVPDGKVDMAVLEFTKDVDKADLLLEFTWTGGIKAAPLENRMSFAPGSQSILHVDLDGAFDMPVQDKTSGEMQVKISFKSAPEEVKNASVADSAAPVIVTGKAKIKLSEVAGIGDDILELEFSEPITVASWDNASIQVLKKGESEFLSVHTAVRSGTGTTWTITFADKPEASFGNILPLDSLRITMATLSDDAGNKAGEKAKLTEVLGKPRPPVMLLSWDKPYTQPESDADGKPDFLVLSPNSDYSWTPVTGSDAGGKAASCGSVACGPALPGDSRGRLDVPALLIEADRAFKYMVTIFTNLGTFVNGFSGEVTNAQLGLGGGGTEGAAVFKKDDVTGKYQIKIAWNSVSRERRKAGTGAYIARIVLVGESTDEKGKAIAVEQKKVVSFGLLRR